MKENILKGKSYQVALSIIKLCQNLTSGKREFVLSKQNLKSGTSIGANVEEANQGESKKDFIHKQQKITLKMVNAEFDIA